MANEKFTFRLLEPGPDGKYPGLVTIKPDGRDHYPLTFNEGACDLADATYRGQCEAAHLNGEPPPARPRPPAEVRSKRV